MSSDVSRVLGKNGDDEEYVPSEVNNISHQSNQTMFQKYAVRENRGCV